MFRYISRKYRDIPWYSAIFHDILAYSVIFRHIPWYSAIFRDIPAFRVFTTPILEELFNGYLWSTVLLNVWCLPLLKYFFINIKFMDINSIAWWLPWRDNFAMKVLHVNCYTFQSPWFVVPGSDGLLSPTSAPNSPVHFCYGDVSECSLLFCTNDAIFRAKFFIKIQNQASDTSRSLPSFSSTPFLLRAVPSERLGQV
jgi:hypothetical protein